MALLLWLYRRRKNGVGFGQLPVRLLSFLRLADPLRSNAAVCVGVRSVRSYDDTEVRFRAPQRIDGARGHG
jgi:hypothetical protein